VSEQEQNAVIGSLVQQYTEAKRSRDLLKEKLREYGSELLIVGERLQSGAFENASMLLRLQVVQEFGLEKLKNLLEEHQRHDKTANELLSRLRNLGINL
jgi:hypothetical protein